MVKQGDSFGVPANCQNPYEVTLHSVRLYTDDPWLVEGEEGERQIGDLRPGERSEDHLFHFRVPDDAALGTHTIVFTCESSDRQVFDHFTYTVEVEKRNPVEVLIGYIFEEILGGGSIPGFPWESIVAGIIMGLGVLAIKRRHRRSNP